ncbi:hypothetical protein N8T08_007936 [Aspergillus melleus]|uniref:Uncharacterized protein n=1 Tax=Aspergillus melleus TaxID=138277 RepID=A0ACC3AWT3_9EURO|nr:hypothetical protein N8T08_007936 [Aspergillus melleus]
MPLPVPLELPQRMEMRKALRGLINHIATLSPVDEIKIPSKIDQLRFEPMVLDEKSENRPSFLTPLPATLFIDPDDHHDRQYGMEYVTFDSLPEDSSDPKTCARAIDNYFSHYVWHCSYDIPKKDLVWSSVNVGEGPYVNLYRYEYPEFGPTWVEQVQKGPYSHANATIYNDLNANDGSILQGELLFALRLIMAQMRRARFIDHLVTPIIVFSFMGPQHARGIEAYMDGHTVVVRPTKLYDLRTKDEAALKTLAQWYFSKPLEPTGSSQ